MHKWQGESFDAFMHYALCTFDYRSGCPVTVPTQTNAFSKLYCITICIISVSAILHPANDFEFRLGWHFHYLAETPTVSFGLWAVTHRTRRTKLGGSRKSSMQGEIESPNGTRPEFRNKRCLPLRRIIFLVPTSQEFFSLSFNFMADSRLNEETPLLRSADDPSVVVRKESREVITPLPKLQIAVLLFIQIAEPICSQSIYPFAPQVIP